MKYEKGDVVQITNQEHHWFPCLIVVSESKDFGIQGYVTVPKKGDAFIRLNHDDFEVVGKSRVIAE